MKRYIQTVLLLSFSGALAFASSNDRVTIYKGKDDSVYDDKGNLCKGSGFVCVEVSSGDLIDLLRFAKDMNEK